AAKQGYVETLFGRRLYVPEINAKNPMQRKAAERAAINAPLQGTAADIIKRAMICIHQWLVHSHIDVKMIMQVHDELIFEVADDVVDKAVVEIKKCMEGAAELSVPLIVDVGVGKNWNEAH
ncbi:MAG: DNA polymerase I, partial [Coxiellaceae bacterium]|nr:DNA polymerase I [Coxiellaceae bacterium]